jgi:hypothetical protein
VDLGKKRLLEHELAELFSMSGPAIGPPAWLKSATVATI